VPFFDNLGLFVVFSAHAQSAEAHPIDPAWSFSTNWVRLSSFQSQVSRTASFLPKRTQSASPDAILAKRTQFAAPDAVLAKRSQSGSPDFPSPSS
jgi:hypothetical protein